VAENFSTLEHCRGVDLWVDVPLVRRERSRMQKPSSSKPDGDSGDSARRLAAIVESSDDAIISTDLEGIILSWNRGATRRLGYAAEETLGQSIAILVPNDLQDTRVDRLEAGARHHYETVRRTKDGRRIDVSVIVSPIEDSSQRVVGASAILRDITEVKAVERALRSSEERWRSIVESAVDGIVVIEAASKPSTVAPSYCSAIAKKK
jgi:PAS domain S-box-containing protein